MKRLIAVKCKDEWFITIERTFVFSHIPLLKWLIKQLGLTITYEDSKKIVAEEKGK